MLPHNPLMSISIDGSRTYNFSEPVFVDAFQNPSRLFVARVCRASDGTALSQGDACSCRREAFVSALITFKSEVVQCWTTSNVVAPRLVLDDHGDLHPAEYFPQPLADVLEAAGYRTGRKSGMPVADMPVTGMHEAAADVISRFGGLVLRFPHAKVPTTMDSLRFMFLFPEEGWYDKAAGERLCPVGTACNDHMDVWVGESGAIYLSMDDVLLRMGRDVSSSLQAIVTGQPGEAILVSD